MEEKMQGIRASDLVVGYEGKSVLKDVNFWVRPGQILTLIGPNGSGKSTLLKSITRQLKTIAGQVYLAEGTMDAYKYRCRAGKTDGYGDHRADLAGTDDLS